MSTRFSIYMVSEEGIEHDHGKEHQNVDDAQDLDKEKIAKTIGKSEILIARKGTATEESEATTARRGQGLAKRTMRKKYARMMAIVTESIKRLPKF